MESTCVSEGGDSGVASGAPFSSEEGEASGVEISSSSSSTTGESDTANIVLDAATLVLETDVARRAADGASEPTGAAGECDTAFPMGTGRVGETLADTPATQTCATLADFWDFPETVSDEGSTPSSLHWMLPLTGPVAVAAWALRRGRGGGAGGTLATGKMRDGGVGGGGTTKDTAAGGATIFLSVGCSTR